MCLPPKPATLCVNVVEPEVLRKRHAQERDHLVPAISGAFSDTVMTVHRKAAFIIKSRRNKLVRMLAQMLEWPIECQGELKELQLEGGIRAYALSLLLAKESRVQQGRRRVKHMVRDAQST